MTVKIRKIRRRRARATRKNKKFSPPLVSMMVLAAIAAIITIPPAQFAAAFEPRTYVLQKALVLPEPNGLNQYPPALEKGPPIVNKRVKPLREYLAGKNSPLAPYADVLLDYYHYRLIIAISFAESNFCKRNIKPYNCWGIGGGNPAAYPDYPYAISRADYFIQKYFNEGLTNPTLMRDRWVGWPNPNWPLAVEAVAQELEAKGI